MQRPHKVAVKRNGLSDIYDPLRRSPLTSHICFATCGMESAKATSVRDNHCKDSSELGFETNYRGGAPWV
jgi:hypothetical protein